MKSKMKTALEKSAEDTLEKSSVGTVVMGESEKFDSPCSFIYGVSKNKAFEDMHAPFILHGRAERLESLGKFENLNDFFIQGISQRPVLGAEPFNLLAAARLNIKIIRHSCHSNKSFMLLILRNLPLLRFCTSFTNSGLSPISSTGCQSCLSIHSKSSSDMGSFSTNFLRISSFCSFSASESMPCLATSVHFISECFLMSFSSSPDTESVIFTQSPYLFDLHNYLKLTIFCPVGQNELIKVSRQVLDEQLEACASDVCNINRCVTSAIGLGFAAVQITVFGSGADGTGGGGGTGGGAGTYRNGGAGGGGRAIRVMAASIADANESVTVGAAGTGGGSGADGVNGGNTTFGSHLTGYGGGFGANGGTIGGAGGGGGGAGGNGGRGEVRIWAW